MLFHESKQKLVKDYSLLTTLLLLFVSLSIYFTGVYMSYKEQLYQIEMLAIEECEELYFKLNSDNQSDAIDAPESNLKYFNRIVIYGYDKDKNTIFTHNELVWSQDFLNEQIFHNNLTYHNIYFYFTFAENNKPRVLMFTRYPLIEHNQYLGEVYVGITITHWIKEQLRIFCILILVIILSIFFIRYVAYKMANKAMIPVVQSFKQQKQFIANASHELRTPLSIIISGLTVLKSDEQNKLSDFSQDIMHDIHDESLRMKKLIDNLLLSARNDNNTLTVQPQKFNLSELIDNIYAKFQLLAHDKKIIFSLETIPEIYVVADKTHIEQILVILMDNAIKYTDVSGSISLCVKKAKHFISISISDNGQGISAENIKHIFEPFYRATKTSNHQGNGLGLAIAKILAEKNNSEITVSSIENKGSCFTLKIKIS